MTSQCVCPKNLNQLLMIEYPGFVKNVDKALDTMGGKETIAKVVESCKDRLELIFRRSDPTAHPVFGDRVSKKCLIVRLRKHKQPSTNKQASFDLSIVGKIQTAYRFETLAEFQWLPMQRTHTIEQIDAAKLHDGVTVTRTRDSLNPNYVSILDNVLPLKNPFDNTLKNFNPDAPLLILPATFSRFDTPRDIHQPHPKFRDKEMRAEFERQQSLAIIGRARKKRATMSYLINFGDPIPVKPCDKLVKDKQIVSPQERSLIPKLKECFERQKVWSKVALCSELECTVQDIKYILPLVSYHYLTGPFRTMWTVYGYDPHKDPASKTLQTLDFRVKSSHDQQEFSRRSMHQYQLPLRKNPDKGRGNEIDLKTVISSATNNVIDETYDDSPGNLKNMAITETMCKFRHNIMPPARQMSYQLKDIELDEVQAIIHANDGKEPSVCSERDGWLSDGSIDKIRKIMNRTLHDTLQESVGALADQLAEG